VGKEDLLNLREKRKLEVQSLIEQRKEEVVKAAISVFKVNGIDNTKMTDIALEAQIGVASLYRYFKTKTELVLESGVYLWKYEISKIYKDFCEGTLTTLNGKDRLKNALNVFMKIYLKQPEILSLLEHFDNYIVKKNISIYKLKNYESNIRIKKFINFLNKLKKKKDGSIRKNVDANLFYITLTHSLISLSQKLVLRGAILKSDQDITGENQLELIINMAIHYISE